MSISSTTTETGSARKQVPAKGRLTEDWMAVVLGFVVIAAVLSLFAWKIVDMRSLVSSFRWTTDAQIASMTPGWGDGLNTIVRDAQAMGQQNVVTLAKGMQDALVAKDRKAIETAAGRLAGLG